MLPRLIALPDSVGVTTAQRAAWQQHLGDLPPIPLKSASTGVYSKQKVAPMLFHPGKTRNSENTEMYVAHPFRVYGLGKPNMAE